MLLALLQPAAAAAQDGAAEIRRRADRLPAGGDLQAILRSAPCAWDEAARHLEPLPSAIPWSRPAAIVVLDRLGAEEGRGVLMRPTRELLARRAIQDLLASGRARLLGSDLLPAPADGTPGGFLLLLPDPPDGPITCTPQGNR